MRRSTENWGISRKQVPRTIYFELFAAVCLCHPCVVLVDFYARFQRRGCADKGTYRSVRFALVQILLGGATAGQDSLPFGVFAII